jgi:hypothetical protein
MYLLKRIEAPRIFEIEGHLLVCAQCRTLAAECEEFLSVLRTGLESLLDEEETASRTTLNLGSAS